MTVLNSRIFDELVQHYTHDLTVTAYGHTDDIQNIAIECRDCQYVVIDFEPSQHEP